jgi:hypothetical protein
MEPSQRGPGGKNVSRLLLSPSFGEMYFKEDFMSFPGKPFFFRGKEYGTPEELGAAFLEGTDAWNDAVFVVGGGFVQKWLEFNGDFGRSAVMEKNKGKSMAEQCSSFVSSFVAPDDSDAQRRLEELFAGKIPTQQDLKEAADGECHRVLEVSGASDGERTESVVPETEPADGIDRDIHEPELLPYSETPHGSADANRPSENVLQPPDAPHLMALSVAGVDGNIGARDEAASSSESYLDAAERGNAEAQFRLGWMYAHADDTGRNDALAVEWYRKAADQGHADAQFVLGWMYVNGRGVPQDDRLALEWYRKAVDRGQANAQYNLGWMYENGRAVRQNYAKAYRLYFRASLHGVAEAEDAMLGLRKKGWLQKAKVSEEEAGRIEREECGGKSERGSFS